jgi:hypothetical protein
LTSVAISPDGTWLVTGSQDRTARVWDAASGKERMTLRGHNGAVNGVAVSPDGALILTASTDKTARLWNGATGEEVSILRGHTDGLTDVGFSPDGKFVATSSSDRTARIMLRDIQDIYALGRTRATRQLSCDEWKGYLQESDYCPLLGVTSGGGGAPPVTVQAAAVAGAATAVAAPSATDEPGQAPTEKPTEGAIEQPTQSATEEPAASATEEPTEGATEEPAQGATEDPTIEPTPTEVTQATPTETAVPTDAPTAAPQVPPGVYAVRMRTAPLDPNQRPLQISFGVNFLNTTNSEVTYSPWSVAIYRLGENKSIGDVRGSAQTVPLGESELLTDPWKAPNVGNCESYTAVPYWEDESNARIPFNKTDGEPMALPFQVCP